MLMVGVVMLVEGEGSGEALEVGEIGMGGAMEEFEGE